jgi:hypothetical protein
MSAGVNRRSVLLAALTTGIATRAAPILAGQATAATESIDLWPGGAPGASSDQPEETVTERSNDPTVRDRAMTGISRPRLHVFRPDAPNGAAVLVMPGGGYERVVIDKEGY